MNGLYKYIITLLIWGSTYLLRKFQTGFGKAVWVDASASFACQKKTELNIVFICLWVKILNFSSMVLSDKIGNQVVRTLMNLNVQGLTVSLIQCKSKHIQENLCNHKDWCLVCILRRSHKHACQYQENIDNCGLSLTWANQNLIAHNHFY